MLSVKRMKSLGNSLFILFLASFLAVKNVESINEAPLSHANPQIASLKVENGEKFSRLSLWSLLGSKPFANLKKAFSSAKVEQYVEDVNKLAELKGICLTRYLVALPLGKCFDPPVGQFSRGRIFYGDKISLPKSLLLKLLERKTEVPWQFSIEKVRGSHDRSFPKEDGVVRQQEDDEKAKSISLGRKPSSLFGVPFGMSERTVRRVFSGALDFRSPDNFVFLPNWMMKALTLRPGDVVKVRSVKLPEGTAIKLMPHSNAFFQLRNYQKILEKELRHYSTLTKGTWISLSSGGAEYHLKVVDVLSGKSVNGVCIQDSDVITDIIKPEDNTQHTKDEEVRRDDSTSKSLSQSVSLKADEASSQ